MAAENVAPESTTWNVGFVCPTDGGGTLAWSVTTTDDDVGVDALKEVGLTVAV